VDDLVETTATFSGFDKARFCFLAEDDELFFFLPADCGRSSPVEAVLPLLNEEPRRTEELDCTAELLL